MLQLLALSPWFSLTQRKTLAVLALRPNTTDLGVLLQMIEAGEVKPTIDRAYALDQVPDALRRVGTGAALGKVIITVATP